MVPSQNQTDMYMWVVVKKDIFLSMWDQLWFSQATYYVQHKQMAPFIALLDEVVDGHMTAEHVPPSAHFGFSSLS